MHARVRNFLGAAIALVILVVLLGTTESTFLTVGNLKNVLITNSSLMIVSVGMTFVLISAGFDLSIGAMMAVSEELLYEFLRAGVPAIGAVALALVAGFLIGALINGVLVGVLGINFFVATLGTMTLLYGLVDVITNGASQTIQSSTLNRIGNGTLWGIPMPILFMVVIVVLGGVTLRWTPYGRSIYGAGGNREAARLAGIPVPFVIMSVYGIAGLCGALAGVVNASRLAAATPTDGSSIALISGAAVLLGGTSLFGGTGGISGTVVGVAVIGVLGNGVNLLGVSNFWQDVVTGAVLIGAILLDRLQRRGQVLH
ncbi:MAG TPA: ABC transporter permease [Acidimicrobiales bacterium]|nr:ABC transporter permease [Acidimicrobiales bacterium]